MLEVSGNIIGKRIPIPFYDLLFWYFFLKNAIPAG
jgi:hypothetical protein